jgi:hypothetical protein
MSYISGISERINKLVDDVFTPSPDMKTMSDLDRFTAMLDYMGIGYEKHECDGDIEISLCTDSFSDTDHAKLCLYSMESHDPYFKFSQDGSFLFYGVNP